MYTEQELSKLIETVEKEFSAHLAKAESADASLSKSEVSGEAAISKVDEVATEPVQKAEEKAEAHPEKEESKEHKEESAHDEHGYDEEDMEHMHKMYSSMTKGELAAHRASVEKAMSSSVEKCGDIQMNKTEETKPSEVVAPVETKPAEETNLMKSENEALKKEIEDLKKNWEGVSGFLTKLVEKTSAPAAKAITSLDVIAKSEGTAEEKKELTKSEITQILLKKTADPSLSKSDRELVQKFYLNGASVDTISHLLKN